MRLVAPYHSWSVAGTLSGSEAYCLTTSAPPPYPTPSPLPSPQAKFRLKGVFNKLERREITNPLCLCTEQGGERVGGILRKYIDRMGKTLPFRIQMIAIKVVDLLED